MSNFRLILSLWLLPSALAIADPVLIDQSVIGSGVMSGVSGIGAVNMASGDANVQANLTAFAGNWQGAAQATAHVEQKILDFTGTMPDVAASSIGANSFAGVMGAFSINQASGSANTQANAIAIAVGVSEVSADALAESSSGGVVWVGPSTGVRESSISDGAFHGAQGIVQLNQTAGVGNSSSNNFALSLNFGPKL